VRVLVTGAAGFVGSELVPALAGSGHELHAVVRDASDYDTPDGVQVLEVDLSGPIDSQSLPEVDAVVHLAQANVPFPDSAGELYAVNTVATQQLLDHARRLGAGKFLFASSGSVYGLDDHPFTEDEKLPAADFYAVTKINAEQLIATYHGFFDSVVFRFFMPYGPSQRGRLIPALIDRVRGGRPVTLNDGGHPHGNPIYIDDVIGLIEAALELQGNHTVNVGGDEVVSIADLALLIGEAVGREPMFEEGSSGATGDVVGDTARMHELFSLRPLVSLSDGIRRTVEASAPEAV
jgi:nucleoside-diphosphate-sugar epimerase